MGKVIKFCFDALRLKFLSIGTISIKITLPSLNPARVAGFYFC